MVLGLLVVYLMDGNSRMDSFPVVCLLVDDGLNNLMYVMVNMLSDHCRLLLPRVSGLMGD